MSRGSVPVTEEPGPTVVTTTRSRLAAVVLAIFGLVGLGVSLLGPSIWPAPWSVGDRGPSYEITSLDHRSTWIRARVEHAAGPFEARLIAAADPLAASGVAVSDRLVMLHDEDMPRDVVRGLADAARAVEQGAWRTPAPVAASPRAKTLSESIEHLVLALVALGLASGTVATFPGWSARLALVQRRTWAGLGALLISQWLIIAGLGLGGVWHSNQHGFQRIADVELDVQPMYANLGTLHGYGFYVIYDPLWWLFGEQLSLLQLAHLLSTATLGVMFLWLRELWQRDGAALAGVAVFASSALYLRLAASESIYVPGLWMLVWTLWWFELYLRERRAPWLWLGMASAFVGMQTRADLILLVPAWILLSWLSRQPRAVVEMGRSRAVWMSLASALALFMPRLYTIFMGPVGRSLSQGQAKVTAPAQWMALALGLFAVLWTLVAWSARRPSSAAWRHWLGALAAVALIAGVIQAWHAGLHPLHPWLNSDLTAVWLWVLPVVGIWRGRRGEAGTSAFLLAAFAVGQGLYTSQTDCLSTYLRTGAPTLLFLAALAGLGLEVAVRGLPRSTRVAAAVACLVSGLWVSIPATQTRYPKQQLGDLVAWIRAHVPPGSQVVWLSDADVPDALRDHELGSRMNLARSVGPAWQVRPASTTMTGHVYAVVTPDCLRPLMRRGGQGASEASNHLDVSWSEERPYAHASRFDFDVQGWHPDGIHPLCRAFQQGEALVEISLTRAVAGSAYENIVGWHHPIGVYLHEAGWSGWR